jgi:hypothetical protein
MPTSLVSERAGKSTVALQPGRAVFAAELKLFIGLSISEKFGKYKMVCALKALMDGSRRAVNELS